MRCSEHVREETLRRFSISGAPEQKFLSVSLRIHGAKQIHPCLFHLCLIDAPWFIVGFQIRSTSLLQFRCIVLEQHYLVV